MEKESTFGVMEPHIKVSGKMTMLKDLEFSNMKELYSKVHSKMMN